jgi:hypothetical protein
LFSFVPKALIVEAKADTGITQVLAGISWAKGQIDVDTTELLIGRGENITLISECERGVGVPQSPDGNGVEALMCPGKKEIKMWSDMKDYRSC